VAQVALAAQEALAAQAVRHGSSCDFQLWTGPNSDFFSNKKIVIAFGFILTKYLVKKNPDLKKAVTSWPSMVATVSCV
jgi:hypothetical protein